MQQLNEAQILSVSGGALTWDESAYAIIALGCLGGPATGLFGIIIGGSMLYVS
jgi:hypothetical protein